MVQAGYEVMLVVPHDRDEMRSGVTVKAVGKPRNRLSRFTRTVWQLYKEALRQHADVYHFHDPDLLPVGLALSLRGKRVIYDVHEDLPRDILLKSAHYLPGWVCPPLSWAMGAFETGVARRMSGVMAATAHIAKRFEAANSRTRVVRNFPLPAELQPDHEVAWLEREHSVAYVGGISIERGIRQMVETMALLPHELNANLCLAGDFREQLHMDLEQVPGWERVQLLGMLFRDDVARLLRRSRVGLVVLLPTPTFVVSLPTKLFEYMAAGIPVVASDFPLWRQIIEGAGCGLLVDPEKPRAIAEAIAYLLTHDDEAEAMGARGRKAVTTTYNWSNEEKVLLRLYAEILNGLEGIPSPVRQNKIP